MSRFIKTNNLENYQAMKKIFSLLLTISICHFLYGQGAVGIGTLNPHAPLQFASVAAERKIVLFEGANNNHQFIGFGVNPYGALKYQTAGWFNDHVFQSAINDSTSRELMRITGFGNVGIGTVPSAIQNRLDIHNGSPRTGTHATGQALYVTGDFANGYGVQFRQSDGNTGIGFTDQIIYAAGSNISQDLWLVSKGPNGNLGFGTNGNARMYIASNGMVGIGNFQPNAPLQFATAAANRKIVLYEGANNDHQFFGFGINSDGHMRFQTPSNACDYIFYSGLDSTSSKQLFRLTGTGSLGLGVTTPLNKLDIAAGPTRTGTHPGGLAAYITGNLGPASFGFEIRNFTGAQGIGLGYNTVYAAGSDASQNLYVGAKGAAGNLILATNATDRLVVAGSGNVGIGVSVPSASAALEVSSGTKGILIPRMSTTERNAIVNPANGLLVFDVTTNSFWFRRLTAWVELNDNLDTEVYRNGADKIYMGLTDSVGIGTLNPAFKLDVRTSNLRYGLAQTDGTIQLATWIGDAGEIGTVTNHAFRLYANDGFKQFELLPNGKIGIGLSGPLNRFDINNGAADRTGTHATNQALYVTGDFGPASNGVQFRKNDGTQGIGFGYNTIYAAGFNTDQDLFLAAKGANGNLSLITNGVERMKISGSGNFGFGVTSPANKLDVHNGTARTNLNSHNTGQALYVTGGGEFRSADATKGLGIGSNIIFATGSLADVDLSMVAKGASGQLIYATNGIERMRITGSGNVGLGISNPNAPLQFSNIAIAKKLVLFDLLNNANEYSGLGVGASGSMLYQVPSESTNFVFSCGAGANSSLELFKFGSLSGFQMNRNLTIDGGMTAWGNVTIGGNATIVGAVTIDSTIITEPFIAPTMTNFTNFGAGYATAAYYKDKMGVVHLRGLVNRAASHNGIVVFTLPVGYRPSTSGKLLFTTQASSGLSRIDILANGDVVVTAGSTGWISLDGITFRAD